MIHKGYLGWMKCLTFSRREQWRVVGTFVVVASGGGSSPWHVLEACESDAAAPCPERSGMGTAVASLGPHTFAESVAAALLAGADVGGASDEATQIQP
jgi:hypothetical protein